MALSIPAKVLHAIRVHAESAYPNEGAGLLLGHTLNGEKVIVDILPMENHFIADEKHHRYLLTPQDMLHGEQEAAQRELDVIGVFHSHPDHPAQPSEFDRDWALPWYSYIITSVVNGRADASQTWLLREDRSAFDEEEFVAI